MSEEKENGVMFGYIMQFQEPESFPPMCLGNDLLSWHELNQYAKETGDITFPLHLARFRAWRKTKNELSNP